MTTFWLGVYGGVVLGFLLGWLLAVLFSVHAIDWPPSAPSPRRFLAGFGRSDANRS